MSILLPLYTYPWAGVWEPLYWEANKNPHLNFTVIINPCSGPCMNSLPPQEYITEIPKLSQYANIHKLGYVATNYTDKPIDDTLAEIRQWGKWPVLMNDSSMAVDGIFFDETPGLYQWQKHDYLTVAATEVRREDGGLGDGVVVHNPGTLPDPTWHYLDIADITVIFEDSFANFISAATFNAIKNFPSLANFSTQAFAVMVHSVGSVPDELTEWTARQMKELAGWNYVTDVSAVGEWWHSFPLILDVWVTEYAGASVCAGKR
ncbi:hypothetical protein P280DRAFT_388554 [Massarina eburnea CBS 473.64]|uniref:Spherulation-specific family 4 n=1 Tax=Massarina eburnea CBS 473.64 TaxID=1395130 RepID=A0A6A6SFJ9_9PLEO|nr:hypothetical protein P280DRAFT_388554 [Massarina eburnea CBS 473.64]